MTIEQADVIDFVSIERNTGAVIVTVSDHLPWDDQSCAHLEVLEAKLNSYLRFIESDEIFSAYPNARGRAIVVEVVGKYELSPDAKQFFEDAAEVVRDAGVTLRFRFHDSPRPT